MELHSDTASEEAVAGSIFVFVSPVILISASGLLLVMGCRLLVSGILSQACITTDKTLLFSEVGGILEVLA